MKIFKTPLLAVLLGIALSGCAGNFKTVGNSFQSPASRASGSQIIPKEYEKIIKVGKPYEIMGKTYYPKYEPDYNEIGIASWYGPGFHGKRTANGEVFDENGFTAAHTTLPMPSLVQVVNLENGKNLVVRINDRGPFKDDRIIDLSKAAARELGVMQNGTARVRVKYLENATRDYLANIIGDKNLQTAGEVFGYNDYAMRQPAITDAYGNVYTSPARDNLANLQSQSFNQGFYQPPAPVQSDAQLLAAQQPLIQPVEPITPVLQQPAASAVVDVVEANTITRTNVLGQPVSPESFIQVASFKNSSNADKLSLKLVDLADVNISEVSISGKTWHRVKVGPIDDSAKAIEILDKVKSMGFSDAKILK